MNVALIPARGGSKSIPLKNIKMIAGKPLIYWTIAAACECDRIDEVYLATDDDRIRTVAEECRRENERINSKLFVISRSPETATDNASTESVMLEFANSHSFDKIVLIQATSPLLSGRDLSGGFKVMDETAADSVLSVVKQYRFLWDNGRDGYASPINYDPYNRPRRQDFDGYYMENGAFYITYRELLLKSKNRISGKICMYECPQETATEIDESVDWLIVEKLLEERVRCDLKEKLSQIRIVLTDCDGCLTDGGMYYSEKGDELKKFNTRDGKAFELLRKADIITGIVTSENVELNKRRADKIKADHLVSGCSDKLEAIKRICAKEGYDLKNVLYIGDDINDKDSLINAGVAACPADAAGDIKGICDIVTSAKGGEGVVREIADLLLRL